MPGRVLRLEKAISDVRGRLDRLELRQSDFEVRPGPRESSPPSIVDDILRAQSRARARGRSPSPLWVPQSGACDGTGNETATTAARQGNDNKTSCSRSRVAPRK